MPKARIKMNKIRVIIRLHSEDCSERMISRATGISRPVVSQYIRQAKSAGLDLEDVDSMDDDELLERLSGSEKRRHDGRGMRTFWRSFLTSSGSLENEKGKTTSPGRFSGRNTAVIIRMDMSTHSSATISRSSVRPRKFPCTCTMNRVRNCLSTMPEIGLI